MRFKESLDKFRSALKLVRSHQIDLSKKTSKFKTLVDFKEKKLAYYIKLYKTSFREMVESSLELNELVKSNKENKDTVNSINRLVNGLALHYKESSLDKMDSLLDQIEKECLKLILPVEAERMKVQLSNIPSDIREDIKADIEEIDSCFRNSCFRSAIIMCGRILETALHRKYYELTGNDLLEKSPGIGLGNMIAKLKEKKINIDPGLTQQIHLINQVRIFSVHKKQEIFKPTKAQTQAIILYTLDAMDKLFKNQSS